MSVATFVPLSSFRSMMMHRHPRLARSRAHASPMPEAPPVTIPVAPSSSNFSSPYRAALCVVLGAESDDGNEHVVRVLGADVDCRRSPEGGLRPVLGVVVHERT